MQVRVPGSFTLHDLHHRVLIPAMGWSPYVGRSARLILALLHFTQMVALDAY
jgi:hypothetical protein